MLFPAAVSLVSLGLTGLAGAPVISIPVLFAVSLSAELAGLLAPSISQDAKEKAMNAEKIIEIYFMIYMFLFIGN